MKPILTYMLIASLALPMTATAQGLRYVKQTIFGMDCAPCAYGVEKGLKALPGVRTVKVSLNEGYAEVTLGDGATTSLTDIRKTIRNNGFTPKQAQVRIEGTLLLHGPQPQLQAGSTIYPLRFDVVPCDVHPTQAAIVAGTVETGAHAVRVQAVD